MITDRDEAPWQVSESISLRDHFAGLAMQGLLASLNTESYTLTGLAEAAYQNADAMLKMRDEQ